MKIHSQFVRSVRNAIAVFAVSLIACATQSQSFNPDTLAIPSTHPRLLFTSAADLTRARAWYATHSYTPATTSAIDQAFVGLMTQTASNCRTAINLVLNNSEYQLSPQLAQAV
ncbi:MAG: hypothetical protein ACRCWJ_02625, partial [Casimicrobium sp.]